jgi:thiol-disulfide isomerase/thioredoxin
MKRLRVSRWTLVYPLVVAAAFAGWFPAVGEEPAKREIDPKAKKVVDEWGKYLSGLKGFQYSADVSFSVERGDQKQSQDFATKLAAQRPNKLDYQLESQQGSATITSDGEQLEVYIAQMKRYAIEKAPATWAELQQVPLVAGPLGLGNAGAVIGALLSDKPGEKLLEKVSTLKYGGLVDVDGVKCHLLEASGQELDWQLWITSGKDPAPRKFVPDLAKTMARMAAAQGGGRNALADLKIKNEVAFKDWKGNPKFDDNTFAIKEPEGAEKAKSLMDILAGPQQRDPGPHPLVGQPAPEVKLDLLDGGKLDLAELKGKVVILDFWATWCGPCTQAMPIIDQVAEKYKDKGVLLYAVNLREEADDIKKFLEQAELELPVALDKDGEVGTAYKADAIPQTVLVGKDGSVQVVRVGLSPNLAQELGDDLESLVAGKNLAAATLKAFKEKQQKQAAETKEADAAAKDAADKKPATETKAGPGRTGTDQKAAGAKDSSKKEPTGKTK